MKEFRRLRAKTYAYLMDDDSEKKKAKGTKKCVIKRRLMFENYRDCLFNGKIILQSQQRFKGDHHDVHTEQINKKVLSSTDDKKLQTFDKTMMYPHGTNAFKVWESEVFWVIDSYKHDDECLLSARINILNKNTKMRPLVINDQF